MSLRILDNNNQSDAAAAIRAINYAKADAARLSVRRRWPSRVRGQRSGAEQQLGPTGRIRPGIRDVAIGDGGDEGILFVAAAGNGNILGNGVDNDRTPFYPASYEADNLIAVAALSSGR